MTPSSEDLDLLDLIEEGQRDLAAKQQKGKNPAKKAPAGIAKPKLRYAPRLNRFTYLTEEQISPLDEEGAIFEPEIPPILFRLLVALVAVRQHRECTTCGSSHDTVVLFAQYSGRGSAMAREAVADPPADYNPLLHDILIEEQWITVHLCPTCLTVDSYINNTTAALDAQCRQGRLFNLRTYP